MSIKTLVINPGSTSTKVGVFEDETLLFEETLRHPTEEIAKYASIIDQKDFRKGIILDFLKEQNCDPKTLNVIVGRGGLLKPIPGGTYAVSDALLADLEAGVQGQHASNLGGILAMRWVCPATSWTPSSSMSSPTKRAFPACRSCRGARSSTR